MKPVTKRQREVLALIAAEKERKEIAAILFITENTVRSNTQRLYANLGVKGKAGAVREGFRKGLLT